jgi:pyridoxal/pyridoxine/pyridoxamine kinase
VWAQAGAAAAAPELLTSGAHTVCANDVAFSAIKTDGSVWRGATMCPSGVQFAHADLLEGTACGGEPPMVSHHIEDDS